VEKVCGKLDTHVFGAYVSVTQIYNTMRLLITTTLLLSFVTAFSQIQVAHQEPPGDDNCEYCLSLTEQIFDRESPMYKARCYNEIRITENDSLDYINIVRVLEDGWGVHHYEPYASCVMDPEWPTQFYCDGVFAAFGVRNGNRVTDMLYFPVSIDNCEVQKRNTALIRIDFTGEVNKDWYDKANK
tara:strand:+ start:897 stop:1451 length:555 start_codon:yes stop_codon:yes gene_type:complete